MVLVLNNRAERSEVPPQPTLSTAAKRQLQAQTQSAQQGSRNGKSAGGDSAAAESSAATPLKWSCAYSFKYRYYPQTMFYFVLILHFVDFCLSLQRICYC